MGVGMMAGGQWHWRACALSHRQACLSNIHTTPSPEPNPQYQPTQVLAAKAALQEFLPVFPDILKGVKTEMAARVLLHRYRSLVRVCMCVFIYSPPPSISLLLGLWHLHSSIVPPSPITINPNRWSTPTKPDNSRGGSSSASSRRWTRRSRG